MLTVDYQILSRVRTAHPGVILLFRANSGDMYECFGDDAVFVLKELGRDCAGCGTRAWGTGANGHAEPITMIDAEGIDQKLKYLVSSGRRVALTDMLDEGCVRTVEYRQESLDSLCDGIVAVLEAADVPEPHVTKQTPRKKLSKKLQQKNAARAGGGMALAKRAFYGETYGKDDDDLLVNGDSAVCDALTDLMHFCHKHGIDFEAALRMAEGHFYAEAIKPDDLAEVN
jgi:hypothetical protein